MVIFVIGLVVLGPKRLPSLARSLGRSLAEFRRASTALRSDFLDVADDFRSAGLESDDENENRQRDAAKKKVADTEPATTPTEKPDPDAAATEKTDGDDAETPSGAHGG